MGKVVEVAHAHEFEHFSEQAPEQARYIRRKRQFRRAAVWLVVVVCIALVLVARAAI